MQCVGGDPGGIYIIAAAIVAGFVAMALTIEVRRAGLFGRRSKLPVEAYLGEVINRIAEKAES